jgi:hypothetical protein
MTKKVMPSTGIARVLTGVLSIITLPSLAIAANDPPLVPPPTVRPGDHSPSWGTPPKTHCVETNAYNPRDAEIIVVAKYTGRHEVYRSLVSDFGSVAMGYDFTLLQVLKGTAITQDFIIRVAIDACFSQQHAEAYYTKNDKYLLFLRHIISKESSFNVGQATSWYIEMAPNTAISVEE